MKKNAGYFDIGTSIFTYKRLNTEMFKNMCIKNNIFVPNNMYT